jgi:esterase/lipase superfamily enzyme
VARKFIQNLVLVAPDIDRDVFMAHAKAVTDAAHRTTIYISRNDMSLRASRAIAGSPRVGDAEAGSLAFPGIDTVDASDSGESTLGTLAVNAVFTDLFQLISENLAPQKRYGLKPVDAGAVRYWQLLR